MAKRARESTWRKAAAEAGRPRDLPPTVLIGLGLLLPAFLVAAGFWAIDAASVTVPGSGVHAPHSDPATGSGDQVLSGSVADGFGIGLIGFGLMLHAHLVTRRLPFVRGLTVPGILAGFLTVIGGVLYAFIGA